MLRTSLCCSILLVCAALAAGSARAQSAPDAPAADPDREPASPPAAGPDSDFAVPVAPAPTDVADPEPAPAEPAAPPAADTRPAQPAAPVEPAGSDQPTESAEARVVSAADPEPAADAEPRPSAPVPNRSREAVRVEADAAFPDRMRGEPVDDEPRTIRRIMPAAPAIALVDAAALGLLLYGASREDTSYYWLAGGAYVAAPLMNVLGGESEHAGKSVGMRIILPPAGAALGAGIGALIYAWREDREQSGGRSSDVESVEEAAKIGFVVGGVLSFAAGIMYAYYEEIDPDEEPAQARRLTPLLAPGKSGVTVGLAGTW